MTRKVRITIWICCLVPAVLIAVAAGIYFASRYEPKFYREALQADAASEEKSSDEMLHRVAALVSNVKKPGKWQTQFTCEQINGWLAVDFVKNHPGALPNMFSKPRVAIESDRIVLGCLYEKWIVSSVLTLTIAPYVPKENVLALRIVKARAGMVPMPLEKVLDAISKEFTQSDWQLRWRQMGGDPVALISAPTPDKAGNLEVKIESIRLENGKIIVSGSTERKK